MKQIFLILSLFSSFFLTGFSQDKPVNPYALELFIQGKTYELQDNYIAAIEKYKEALKYEKAAGIYYTLSKLYSNVSQYQKSLENAKEAVILDPSNTRYKENAADVYIVLNDYENALKLLREVSEKKPDDLNILYNIGRIYEAQKQVTEALKYYEKITEDFQYDETVLRRMITIYENYHDYANEAATMEKLLVLEPANYELKLLTAETYLKVPDYDNALKILEALLAVNPKSQDIQSEIIRIYFKQNRTDLAFEKFGKLINKDSIDFPTKMGIALSYFDAAKDDSSSIDIARTILQTVKSSYPREWLPDFYLALIDIREKNNSLAEQKFKTILIEADTSSEAYTQIGAVYLDQNKPDEALKIFLKGVKLFPDDFRLNYLTGFSHSRLGQNKESYPYLEKALSITPNDINVLSTLGLVYDNLGMDAECERVYEQALKYYPDNILILNNYAYHLSERDKDLVKALAMSKKSIDKEPENSSYLDTYGWIFYKMKDYKNALKYIEKAVRNGSNAVLLEHLADVYAAMGEITTAIKFWRQSLEKDPNNKAVQDKLDKYK